jgi:hypothetical protein
MVELLCLPGTYAFCYGFNTPACSRPQQASQVERSPAALLRAPEDLHASRFRQEPRYPWKPLQTFISGNRTPLLGRVLLWNWHKSRW